MLGRAAGENFSHFIYDERRANTKYEHRRQWSASIGEMMDKPHSQNISIVVVFRPKLGR